MSKYIRVKQAMFIAYHLFALLTAILNLFNMSQPAYRWLLGVASAQMVFADIFWLPGAVKYIYNRKSVVKDEATNTEEEKLNE